MSPDLMAAGLRDGEDATATVAALVLVMMVRLTRCTAVSSLPASFNGRSFTKFRFVIPTQGFHWGVSLGYN